MSGIPHEAEHPIRFVRKLLQQQDKSVNQYPLPDWKYGRKVRGFKKGDGETLTKDEIKKYRKELIMVLKHWDEFEYGWTVRESKNSKTLKLNFRRANGVKR